MSINTCGETTADNMGPKSDRNHHFKGKSAHAGRILNFYNTADKALTAWEFDQLTKPDVAQGNNWFYTNSYRKAYADYETCPFLNSDDPGPEAACVSQLPAIPNEVVSEFQEGRVVVPYNSENAFRILAYSVPARTELGSD